MKSRKIQVLAFILLLSFAVCSTMAYADSDYQSATERFSLENINPSMTVTELFLKHPEVYDIYYLRRLSAEEVQEAVRDGKRIINGDDYYAKEFFSMANDRRESCIDTDCIPDRSNGNERSSYGAAWPYTFKTGENPNCYSYAIGVTPKHDPGYKGTPVAEGSSVYTVASKVISDMVANSGGGRIISSNTASIYSYEWRIACRTGSVIVQTGNVFTEYWDYHFWLQTSTGSGGWCHKPGPGDSAYLGNVTPHTASWGTNNFYNSATVYLAVYYETE